MKKLFLILLMTVMTTALFSQTILITTPRYQFTDSIEMMIENKGAENVTVYWDGLGGIGNYFLDYLAAPSRKHVPSVFAPSKHIYGYNILNPDSYQGIIDSYDTIASIDASTEIEIKYSVDGIYQGTVVHLSVDCTHDYWIFLCKGDKVIRFDIYDYNMTWPESQDLNDYEFKIFAHIGKRVVGVKVISVNPNITGITELAKTQKVYCYNRVLTTKNVKHLKIIDISGRVCYNEDVYNNLISVVNYHSGIYFAKTDAGRIFKFLIE